MSECERERESTHMEGEERERSEREEKERDDVHLSLAVLRPTSSLKLVTTKKRLFSFRI